MLTEALNAPESRRLLKIVDDMREILHHEKISLPHIVVVGDQSVTKNRNLLIESISYVLRLVNHLCSKH
jgi:hypothetical protein